jgi:acetylornithine deacetylase/succinyl-diaminopimelate desuccinylase-like protein
MTTPLNSVKAYLETHFEDYIEQLKTLVRIPSVSFAGFDPQEVVNSAKAVAQLMKDSGLEHVELIEMEGVHPYVYGDWLHTPGAPTLLLYAHHDVQPTMREEVWKSPPFEPTLREGRLYGRGTADDKAGILVHTASIHCFLQTLKTLPVNVKMIIEGEEEIGSSHLLSFLEKYKEKLRAEVMILTDCGNYDTGIPTLTTSLRGLVCVEVTVSALDHPLHSGMWGGAIPDPVMALSKMLASLVDENGEIAIPGILEKVKAPSPAEKTSMEKLAYTESELRRQACLLEGTQLVGGKGSILEKMWRKPSVSINCFEGGSRKNTGNVIQDQAWARVGVRIGPGLEAKEIERLLIQALRERAPWGVHVEVETEACSNAWSTAVEHPAFEKARSALAEAYGKDTVYMGCGGSIPFVAPFSIALGNVPAMLVGVEDPYTNAHSENESLHLGDFKKSILGEICMFQRFAELVAKSR